MNWLDPGLAKVSVEAPVLDPQLLKAFALLYVQLLVVTSVALFFSTFSGPMLSAAFTFGLYIVGHFNADLAHFENVVKSPAAAWLGKALYYVLPNLAPFDVKAAVVHGQAVSAAYVALHHGYGLLYAGAMIALAVARLLAAGLQVAMGTPVPLAGAAGGARALALLIAGCAAVGRGAVAPGVSRGAAPAAAGH